MKPAEWVYAQMHAIEDQLHEKLINLVGAPNFDQLTASAHAYAFGQMQGLVDVCIREGVQPRTTD